MSKDSSVLLKTELPLPMFVQGKVRDTYDLGEHLLIVVTDRISAYDVVLPCGIPDKGAVLNQMSAFWFQETASIMPNHVVETIDDVSRLDAYIPTESRFPYPSYLEGRSMIVKKVERLLVECVVRGYISGSAWAEYSEQGTINGQPMPAGLQESEEFPQPLFTPTTKADDGHDEPLTPQEMNDLVGEGIARQLAEKTITIYNYARKYARERGLIIADTKVEFGQDDGRLILIDELLTPDSSRFWEAKLYQVGQSQPSYDKQPVRDWVAGSGWDKKPPAPTLPPEVIQQTTDRYRQAYERLSGRKLK